MTQDNKGQTQMTNPPADESKLKESAPKVKLVKVKVLEPIRVDDPDHPGQTKITPIGTIVELPESQVKELEKPIQGQYAFSGERHDVDKDIARHQIVRVQRVS